MVLTKKTLKFLETFRVCCQGLETGFTQRNRVSNLTTECSLKGLLRDPYGT